MRCPKCGRVNREDALYCWNCLVKFADLAPRQSEGLHAREHHPRESHARETSAREEAKGDGDTLLKKKAGYLLFGLGVALVVVLGIAAYFFFGMS